MFVFSRTFLVVLWKSTFPMFWELHGLLHQLKYLRNITLEFSCFPTFFANYVNRLPHVFGIVWISASPEIFKKLENLGSVFYGSNSIAIFL